MTRLRLLLLAVAVGLMFIGPLWIWASTVTLQWDPITDASVKAVSVYRGANSDCDSLTPLGSLLVTLGLTNTYVDAAVPESWQRVCYEITASNSAGESGHSNRASKSFAVAPLPPPAPPTNLRLSQWNGDAWVLLASA